MAGDYIGGGPTRGDGGQPGFQGAPRPYGPKSGGGRPPEPRLSTPSGIPAAQYGPNSSPVTDELTRARFTRATVSNPNQLVGNSTDKAGWTSITVDRPTIVWCVTAELKGVLYYAPDRQPSRDIDAIASSGHGVCYLSGPGTWWLKYNAGDGTRGGVNSQVVDVLMHDAADPAVASKYLSEPGIHDVNQTHVQVTSNTTPDLIIAGNVRRKALFIQNLTPNTVIRLGFQRTLGPTAAPAPNGALGIRLGGTAGNSITLSGDTLVKGNIYSVLEASTGFAEVEVAEFY